MAGNARSKTIPPKFNSAVFGDTEMMHWSKRMEQGGGVGWEKAEFSEVTQEFQCSSNMHKNRCHTYDILPVLSS